MKTAEPIRDKGDIKKLKLYFIKKKEYRNYFLVVIGVNTALRISDILKLKWDDLYSYEENKFKKHIRIKEQKTGKEQIIFINDTIKIAAKTMQYKLHKPDDYIFVNRNNLPISRIQVNRILDKVCKEINIAHISCHSFRKTFGYHAWKSGVEPVVLMNIYNNSNFQITKRYLGICQMDKDNVYDKIQL